MRDMTVTEARRQYNALKKCNHKLHLRTEICERCGASSEQIWARRAFIGDIAAKATSRIL